MNYSSFLIKLIDQVVYTNPDYVILKGLVVTKPSILSKSKTQFIIFASCWGKYTDLVKNYKKNDYIYIEGFLTFHYENLKYFNQINDKKIEVLVSKIYPIYSR